MCAFGNLYPQHYKFDTSILIPHQIEKCDHSVTSSCLEYCGRIWENCSLVFGVSNKTKVSHNVAGKRTHTHI